MKRIVKTAKQQFEERLDELTLIKEFQSTPTDVYFLCENTHGEMSILRKIHNEEFFEYKYEGSYRELIESELFLDEITGRFVEVDISVKPLFDWYASADKDNEPFTLDDIWMCNLELIDHSVIFEDLYEEISDVRVITAKEQWEKDSTEATTTLVRENDSYRVILRGDGIEVYIDKGGKEYSKETLPSLEELRKDAGFVTAYVSYISENRSNFMKDALKWLDGGEYTMNEWGVLDIYVVCMGRCNTSYRYEDKPIPEKKDFTDEMDMLQNNMCNHIKHIMLAEGMLLDSDLFLSEANMVMWKTGGAYDCANIRAVYLAEDVDEIILFCFEPKCNKAGDSEDYLLCQLSIETLHQIIKAMK